MAVSPIDLLAILQEVLGISPEEAQEIVELIGDAEVDLVIVTPDSAEKPEFLN